MVESGEKKQYGRMKWDDNAVREGRDTIMRQMGRWDEWPGVRFYHDHEIELYTWVLTHFYSFYKMFPPSLSLCHSEEREVQAENTWWVTRQNSLEVDRQILYRTFFIVSLVSSFSPSLGGRGGEDQDEVEQRTEIMSGVGVCTNEIKVFQSRGGRGLSPFDGDSYVRVEIARGHLSSSHYP